MKSRLKKLTTREIKKIQSYLTPIIFNNSFDFVYEKQVPNTAILLTAGELQLYQKNRLMEIINPGHLLGAYQLIHNEPVNYACKIGKSSEAILIDKSTLIEASADPKSPLATIIKDLKNSKN